MPWRILKRFFGGAFGSVCGRDVRRAEPVKPPRQTFLTRRNSGQANLSFLVSLLVSESRFVQFSSTQNSGISRYAHDDLGVPFGPLQGSPGWPLRQQRVYQLTEHPSLCGTPNAICSNVHATTNWKAVK